MNSKNIWMLTLLISCLLTGCQAAGSSADSSKMMESNNADTVKVPAYFSGRNMEFQVMLPRVIYDQDSGWYRVSQADREDLMEGSTSIVDFNEMINQLPTQWNGYEYASKLGPYFFQTSQPLEEIGTMILKWDSNAVIEIWEDSLFISSQNPDTGKSDYYHIYKVSPLWGEGYNADTFAKSYTKKDDEGNDYEFTMLIPMHLIQRQEDKAPVYLNYGKGERHRMLSGATVEDVYDFYNDSGYYEAERDGNRVILKQTLAKDSYEKRGDTANYDIDNEIVLEVITEGDKSFFSCTDTKEEDSGNDSHAQTIKVPAFFSGRPMEFDLNVTGYHYIWDPSSFSTLQSLEEMKDAILKWDSNAVIETWDDSLFISSQNPVTGKKDYYYIYRSFSFRQEGYRTGDLTGGYVKRNKKTEDEYFTSLFPKYLLKRHEGKSPAFLSYGQGERYEMQIGATIENIYDFYHESGYYEVEREGNQVILHQLMTEDLSDIEEGAKDYNFNNKVVVEVIKEGGQSFFTASFVNN